MLTDTACKNAKPQAKIYSLTDGDGMFLEIHPHGGRYWRIKYRFAGKQKRLALGVYPEVSLSEARDKRQAARKLLREGQDPAAKKQEAKRQVLMDAETTFKAVAKLWHEKKSQGVSERYAGFMWRRVEADIITVFGDKPIASITSLEIIQALQRVEARGAHELARRLKQSCDEIYRYAVVHGLASSNPVANFQSRDVLAKYRKGHFASIEPREIPAFLAALEGNEARLFRLTRLALKLLMLTFVRTNELINARWEEVDLKAKEWVIPAERMKMRRPHIVPLCKQTLAIFEELKNISGHREFVFPGQTNPRKSMSNNTILQALSILGYKGKMTGHGFRALAMSTIKEKLGYRHEVVDRQLAHAPKNKIDAAYDRAQFIEERRTMMQQWADYLDTAATRGKVIKPNFEKAS
jgi:integrase